MQLDELQKPKEIGQLRSYIDQTNPPYYADRELQTKVSEFMEKYQFSHAGSGSFATVYTSPKYPFALKIFQRDSGYMKWLNFCKKNQDNPLVPKIRGNLVKIHKFIYAVRIEKLLPVDDDDLDMETDDDFMSEEEYLFKQKILFNYDPFIKIEPTGNSHIDSIIKLFAKNEGMVDLHNENIMKRENGEFVIIDPFAGSTLYESQQIDELKKPEEITQFRNKDKEINNPYDSWRELAEKYLKKYHFKISGIGTNASVFVSDRYPFALKVFKKDSGYEKWLKFCYENQDNPLIPKTRGKIVKINDHIYAARIEKLEPYTFKNPIGINIRKTEENFQFICLMQADDLWNGKFNLIDSNHVKAVINSNEPLNRHVTKLINFFKDNYEILDMHIHNVMKRDNGQIVVIDPFYDKFNEAIKMPPQTQTITEKHYRGPLYHSTSMKSAATILDTEVLKMSSIKHETRVNKLAPKGYEYWLSVSRDKNNSYKKGKEVTFVLDSEYIDKWNEYVMRPVEYFANGKKYRTEAEERIFSKSKNYIESEIIFETHVDCNFLRYNFIDFIDEHMNHFFDWTKPKKEMLNQIEYMLKDIEKDVFEKLHLITDKSRICYMYLNLNNFKNDYNLLNKKKATTDINNIKEQIIDYSKNYALEKFNYEYSNDGMKATRDILTKLEL